ncbi:MAG: ABC transporter ATP-binding protein/permease [Bacteroidota bacterium]|nr:ABC transporter ATP-binding protein [Flavisolibacter sp.]MDQ3844351.1 ABC transporter ATP-binding protein/permease [Bacteroidota bacterium]MBD0284885.1 ABC transporter ATP-binding protein [Flavisolibacter sp.]MBD0294981.1 ABC transporter ATP-binding protein [Flavisolibacter sp.]MBD0351347.1 ABC transporter ATP-binding protein [Flavisolibacter sp.]
MKHLKALTKYFIKYKVRLSIGIIFIIISNYFGVLAPQVTGFIIDFVQRALHLPGYQSRTQPARYDILVQLFIRKMESLSLNVSTVVALSGITILLLALLRGFFMFLMRQTIIVMSRHIEYDQKNEVFAHYEKLDMAFYKTHSTGDLMSRMAEDVSRVRMFTGPAIMYLINLVFLISLSLFFMIKRSPELTLYVLTPLPVLAVIIYLVNNIIHKKSEALQTTLASLTTNAQQSYSGIRVIKSFVQENAMLQFFTENSDKYKKEAVALAKIEALYFPSMGLFIGLSTLLTIMIGGLHYINGSSEVGLDAIVEFVIYINMLTFPVSAIGWTASMIQRSAASQKRLNEFLDTTPSITDSANAKEVTLTGHISFQRVNFIYPHTGIHAVKDFNLEIKPGQKVALIGRTGSGKSTIAQLLLRMYDVTSGKIELDGTPIEKINLESLRRQISYTPQDGFLFSDTIQNNIAFGTIDADLKKVEHAAYLSAVDKDINGFPDGFQTMIGERGVTLSGGQKQRVSIARALMKETPILLLDDCLSAVDARTEREILIRLNDYLKEKAAIFITHRISDFIHFDKIIVLEDGEIAEQGTHEQLLARKGLYAAIYFRQLQQDDDKVTSNLAV